MGDYREETEGLGLIGRVDVYDCRIEIYKTSTHITAYSEIKGSKILNLEKLNGSCTYQEGDVFGVDTAHHYQSDYSMEEKTISAINQIISVIESIQRILK